MTDLSDVQHPIDSAITIATLHTIFGWINHEDKPVSIMLAELSSNIIDAVINTGYIVTGIKTNYQQDTFVVVVKLKRCVAKKWQKFKWEIHIPLTNNEVETYRTTHNLGYGAANND